MPNGPAAAHFETHGQGGSCKTVGGGAVVGELRVISRDDNRSSTLALHMEGGGWRISGKDDQRRPVIELASARADLHAGGDQNKRNRMGAGQIRSSLTG